MSKTPFVLQALKILGLEEMLKLSEVLHVRETVVKKVAGGGEIIVWDDAPPEASEAPKVAKNETPGKVLDFPKKTIQDLAPPMPEKGEEEEEGPSFVSSELVLWQREITRNSGDNIQKLDAFKGYRKSTEMYVVKTHDQEGKDKIRFASTNGVLVNKKQA